MISHSHQFQREKRLLFFFDKIGSNCGEEEMNEEKGLSGQEFEMWVVTEDRGCCLEGEIGVSGIDIREDDIMS